MVLRLLPMSALGADAIDAVAALHVDTVQSLLSDLGLHSARLFYRQAQRHADSLGVVAMEDGAVVGFAFGGPNPGAYLSALRRRPFALVWRAFLRRPGLLYQAIVSRVKSAGDLTNASGAVELMYIAVSPELRRRGCGAELLEQFVESARASGADTVTLSVETSNDAAVTFYKRSGFETTGLIREGKYKRWRMARRLRQS